ncbi:9202_t:CDS:2 [Racocetra fulgida]|uniref:9202_t:CDS:1 n=1 Tax=Racocetra fulgida TaxID=60492 RepID=A0A9N9APY1_9GLOM|nr:9202_t:CDS:2 [Racocetra fulgida]
MIEGVEIVVPKVMIEEVEIGIQEVMIKEISQEVMIEVEIVEIVEKVVVTEENDQEFMIVKAVINDIQKLFQEFIKQNLKLDNTSLFIDYKDQSQDLLVKIVQEFKVNQAKVDQKPNSPKRARTYDTDYYEKEQSKPFQAPDWTINGYRGSLRTAIQNACCEQSSTMLFQTNSQENTQRPSQISDC